MRRTGMFGYGTSVVVCLVLLASSGGAQQAKPIIEKQAAKPIGEKKVILPVTLLDAEPKLHTKVWLVAPDSDIARLLTELMARTTPLTHLKLQAQSSVQKIPVACFAAGTPLRDLLDGLTAPGALQWRRTNPLILQLGVGEFDLQHGENQNRIAYYGMRVVLEAQRQPGDIWETITRRRARLGSLPPTVQQAVQSLLRIRADLPQPQNLPRLEVPADPKEMSISVDEELALGRRSFLLRFLQERPVTGGLSVMEIGLRFNPGQAIAYVPRVQDEDAAQERDNAMNDSLRDAIKQDSRFTQTVTLNLHAATLAEALQALFTATRLPMLAFTAPATPRADLAFARLPLQVALDRICAAYGCRWQRRDSGLVTLLKATRRN